MFHKDVNGNEFQIFQNLSYSVTKTALPLKSDRSRK